MSTGAIEHREVTAARRQSEAWIFQHEAAAKEKASNLTLKEARNLLHDLDSHARDLSADLALVGKTKKLIRDELLRGAGE